jgi:hypothetical protein
VGTLFDVPDPVAQVHEAVLAAAAALRGSGPDVPGAAGNGHGVVEPNLERPKRAGQGDYATNAAMLLAPKLGAPPREIAARLGEELKRSLGDTLVSFEVAGPGFLNLTLSDDWVHACVRHVLDAGPRFAAGGATHPERILLEFVSANPPTETRLRGSCATTATPWRPSTTSTMPARRSAGSGSRCAPEHWARSRPRAATRGIT